MITLFQASPLMPKATRTFSEKGEVAPPGQCRHQFASSLFRPRSTKVGSLRDRLLHPRRECRRLTKDGMLSGTHRNSLQEQVIYGRPALEALTDLAKAFGAHRLMITSTASLAGPGGLAQHLAKDTGAACVGIFAGVSAHSPREGVIAGAAEARRLGADLLVAVGGGSVIDATKVMQLALWAGVENVEGLGVYRVGPGPDRADVSKLTPGVRMVAIPTTLSAAEFTAFAGVTDVSPISGEPARAFVDAAIRFNEIGQALIGRFGYSGVLQDPRPFASGLGISDLRIGGAEYQNGERLNPHSPSAIPKPKNGSGVLFRAFETLPSPYYRKNHLQIHVYGVSAIGRPIPRPYFNNLG
jgi:hypothetical protein